MSMHVVMAVDGVAELDLMLAALKKLHGEVCSLEVPQVYFSRQVVAFAMIEGDKVGIGRNRDGELCLVGDDNWPAFKKPEVRKKIRQACSRLLVERELRKQGFRVATVENLADGSLKLVAVNWR
jgi:hypothetical protein